MPTDGICASWCGMSKVRNGIFFGLAWVSGSVAEVVERLHFVLLRTQESRVTEGGACDPGLLRSQENKSGANLPFRHPGLVPGSTVPRINGSRVRGTVDAGTSPA